MKTGGPIYLGILCLVFQQLNAQSSIQKTDVINACNYPSLQEAINALPAEGGMVSIPPGEYRLETPLVLSTSNTRIEGSGAATHLINDNKEGLSAFKILPNNSANEYLWRIQIGNLRISGNEKSGDGLYLEKVNELYLHGLSIDHHGKNGIHMLNCYENPRLAQCNITYNKASGISINGGHDIVVSTNELEENLDGLHVFDSFNLTMTGNNIDDHLRHGVVIENTYGSVISGNMIEECIGTAIVLDRDCYGITVSANNIAHNLGGGVALKDAWGSSISANTFVLVHKSGVLVEETSGRITITGNNFSNSFIGHGTKRDPFDPASDKGPMQWDEGSGIVLNNTSDVAISGNIFSGLSAEAVKATGKCHRALVSNNIMTDLGRRTKGDKVAIDMNGATNTMVKDNVVESGLIVKQ